VIFYSVARNTELTAETSRHLYAAIKCLLLLVLASVAVINCCLLPLSAGDVTTLTTTTIAVHIRVLAMDSQHKGISAPFHVSLLGTEERIQLVGNLRLGSVFLFATVL